jgi:hypothetical protein
MSAGTRLCRQMQRPAYSREAECLLYQTEDGRTRVEVRFDGETAWLSLSQMAELFQRDKSVIARHVKTCSTRASLSALQLLQNLQPLQPTVRLPRHAVSHLAFASTSSRASHLTTSG